MCNSWFRTQLNIGYLLLQFKNVTKITHAYLYDDIRDRFLSVECNSAVPHWINCIITNWCSNLLILQPNNTIGISACR